MLRSRLFSLGFRFRKNVEGLPGKPDIVFPTERIAVFCDGDFWHGRELVGRIHRLERGSNARYWVAKIRANVSRDRQIDERLGRRDRCIVRLWESDILKNAQQAAKAVADVVQSRRTTKTA